MQRYLKINMLLLRVCLICICIVCWQRCFAADFIQAPAAIQISSRVSDGKYTISEIVAIAKESGIKVLVITDSNLMRWEYGLWPLRNIIKKTVEEKSVFRYGVKRYLDGIDNIQKNTPELVLIGGLESAPFYFWQGSIFGSNLKINNWHKHILVVGLEKLGDYKNLPIVGNKKGLFLPFRLKNIFFFWPLIIFLLGILFLGKMPGGAIITIIAGLVFLWNGYPFRDLKFDQYQGDLGIKPYQIFIDYVNRHGGLSFWAHPEAKNFQRLGRVSIETRDYASDLLQIDGYTGFAVFYEGYEKVGCIGGIWDEVLNQYCRGIRKSPIWSIGGLGFESTGNLDKAIKDLRTVFLIPKLNKTEVLKALREGRMYVVRGRQSSQFCLDKFVLKNPVSGVEKTMGEEMEWEDKPQLKISGYFLNGKNQLVKIKLIRGGRTIKAFETSTPFDLLYIEEEKLKEKKNYYRLEIESDGLLLITNPIFVTKLIQTKM